MKFSSVYNGDAAVNWEKFWQLFLMCPNLVVFLPNGH